MYFILALGAAALLVAASQAARPDAAREGFLKWISRALLWATLCGIAFDIATTCRFVASDKALAYFAAGEGSNGTTRARVLIEGVAESMSPAIVGFAFLAIVALLAAVGRRRLDANRS